MTSQNRCKLLLRFRDEGVRIGTFFGIRWVLMKAALLCVSLVMVSTEDAVARTVGLIALGYTLGKIAAGSHGYIVGKKAWAVDKEFLDWQKVEACAKGPNS